ncbi:MAG: hypothetical protein P4M13_02140 [Alphaproteobacteria bacterium]|nr:hypothetical protein [Alphaproteobacteria bacterium]
MTKTLKELANQMISNIHEEQTRDAAERIKRAQEEENRIAGEIKAAWAAAKQLLERLKEFEDLGWGFQYVPDERITKTASDNGISTIDGKLYISTNVPLLGAHYYSGKLYISTNMPLLGAHYYGKHVYGHKDLIGKVEESGMCILVSASGEFRAFEVAIGERVSDLFICSKKEVEFYKGNTNKPKDVEGFIEKMMRYAIEHNMRPMG